MTKKHSYCVNNQPFRLTILSWIALATFVTVLLIDSVKKGSFDFSSLKTYFSSASLVTITFAIIYWVYDQFIWKINWLDKVPDLSGTWIGIARNINPPSGRLRLELMKIDQHWSKIRITVKVYQEIDNDQGDKFDALYASKWLEAIREDVAIHMGTEYSTIALITECEGSVGELGELTFNYHHSPIAQGQDSFEGVMFLNYIREEFHELQGNYLNTKKVLRYNQESQSKEIFFHSVIGRVVFCKVSSKLLGKNEALQETEKEKKDIKDIMVKLYKKLTSHILED